MRKLLRLVRAAAQLPALLASAVLFALMLMTFADVVLRSTASAPIEAATELTRIAMAVIVFSVLPVVSGRGEHITVDLTDPWFGPKATRWRECLIALACGAMLFWPAGAVLRLAERARGYGDVTEYLGIPDFYTGGFIAACVYLAAIVLVARGLILAIAPNLLAEPERPE